MEAHPIYRVTSFKKTGPHSLTVVFDDDTSREIDFGVAMHGPLYGPLADPAIFAQVRIDPEVHTLAWPNGADFDPLVLHDWPDYQEGFATLARRWHRTESRVAEATPPYGGKTDEGTK